VKSRIGGAAGDDGGVDAGGGVDADGGVCAGATHTLDLSRGLRALAEAGGALVAAPGGVRREVGVTGEVGTAWVGAGGVGAVAMVAGVGADPTKDACPGWSRATSPKPPTTRTAAPDAVINRTAPRVHFTGERYRAGDGELAAS